MKRDRNKKAAVQEQLIRQKFKQGKKVFQKKTLLTPEQRSDALQRLETGLRTYERELLDALRQDLNKSVHEAYMTEIGLAYSELRYTQKHLRKWLKPKRAKASLGQLPGSVHLYRDPYGCVLIMSPWNYPVLLTINPLVSALAAGNSVILKPSTYSPQTSHVLTEMIEGSFPDHLVQIVAGGRQENQTLLNLPFDYIFFTGSPRVGRVVMTKAAKNLTPITLELGGKSPVIVDSSADIDITAKRILFGKLLNAGQTCIAPDHVFAHRSIKPNLIDALVKQSKVIFKNPVYLRRAWPKIISPRHFDRIMGLIEKNKVVCGGVGDSELQTIEFTILDEPSYDSPVMQEEIFGPLLPILPYDDLTDLIYEQQRRPKPLALYLFTKNKQNEKRVLKELSYGGGCVNDTILHISSTTSPFGGVGNSGMGNYHGKFGFDTFTHQKTVLKKWWLLDVPVRHHPYKSPDSKLPEWMLR
ncbi:MAG TPA: aldehyde dehydrogenase family protein [Clostridiaceae bacterium]|nr:aldehyde dehydrogenase family protein [Clostridiaceae bacterium]